MMKKELETITFSRSIATALREDEENTDKLYKHLKDNIKEKSILNIGYDYTNKRPTIYKQYNDNSIIYYYDNEGELQEESVILS